MKSTRQVILLLTITLAIAAGSVTAQLHLDPDTGKEIADGFDIRGL